MHYNLSFLEGLELVPDFEGFYFTGTTGNGFEWNNFTVDFHIFGTEGKMLGKREYFVVISQYYQAYAVLYFYKYVLRFKNTYMCTFRPVFKSF